MSDNIFNWNHISNKLSKDQVDELKSYYKTYHRKCWAYKKYEKKFKRLRLLGDSLSIIFATGGLSSSIATGGIALVAISTSALLIQLWMKHKDLELKIHNCIYAHQSYQHLLDELREMLRSGNIINNDIYIKMKHIDDYVTDNAPIVDKYYRKYDRIFQESTID